MTAPTPIPLARIVKEFEELKQLMDDEKMIHGEYDQRVARIITELRDRKIEGDRGDITATIDDLLQRGVITPAVKEHLISRLGLQPKDA